MKVFFINVLKEIKYFIIYFFTLGIKNKNNLQYNFLRSLIIDGLFAIVGVGLMVLGSIILTKLNIEYTIPTVTGTVSNVNPQIDYPWYLLLLVGGIIAPLGEELAFRLPLKYGKFYLCFAILAFYIVSIFLNQTSAYYLFVDFDIDYFTKRLYYSQNFSYICAICFVLSFIPYLIKPINKFLEKIWTKMNFYLLLILCFIFAILHAPTSFFLNPLWSIVQTAYILIPSFYIGYIRLQYGFKKSTIIHVTYNIILMLLGFLGF